MDQEFMKEKPVMPLVISMALPMTFSMLVNALYNIIDSYFVAQISEDAMTALSLVFPLQNLVNAVVIGFAIGMNAAMAYYLGAQKQQMADKTASIGMLLNMLHGLVLAAICIAVMPVFLGMFTKQAGIIGMGVQYSDIVFLFAVPNAAALCFEKIFQAVGRMKTSMFCMLLGCVTNIVLDPLLIFGIGIFPAMGIRGAALATGIGQIVSLAGYLTAYYWNSCQSEGQKYEAGEAALQKSVFYRNPCNVKPCAAFRPGVCIKCDTGCLFCKLCSCIGCLFQITDIFISDWKWCGTGDASIDWIQLWSRRVKESERDFSVSIVPDRNSDGDRYDSLYGNATGADRSVYRKS
mgnify:CR=1 FL=1